PLYQYLLGVTDPVHRPAHILRSTQYWYTVAKNGLAAITQDKVEETDRENLGHMLFAHFLGLLELWVHEDIDDETFRARAVYGGWQMLMGFANTEHASKLQTKLNEIKTGNVKTAAH